MPAGATGNVTIGALCVSTWHATHRSLVWHVTQRLLSSRTSRPCSSSRNAPASWSSGTGSAAIRDTSNAVSANGTWHTAQSPSSSCSDASWQLQHASS